MSALVDDVPPKRTPPLRLSRATRVSCAILPAQYSQKPFRTTVMELEAKFRVDDDQPFDELRALTALGPFRLVLEPTPEDQRNTYFDTADDRLRTQRYGLRIRDLGDRRIATLKGASSAREGVYERDEWEVVIGDDDRPAAWPPSEARERVLALLDGAPLQPILTIRTTRQHIYALRDDTRIAELSLDAGTISAGGLTEAFRELEIELLADGTRADFDALIALLRERLPLVAEDRSKLARGLALLDRAAGHYSDSPSDVKHADDGR